MENSKNICPPGWHLPSIDELTVLSFFLDGDTVAGGKMKEIGTAFWQSPNIAATNSSRFTALPGGFGDWNGVYSDIGTVGGWWTSTRSKRLRMAFVYEIGKSTGKLYINDHFKRMKYSIRCIKE